MRRAVLLRFRGRFRLAVTTTRTRTTGFRDCWVLVVLPGNRRTQALYTAKKRAEDDADGKQKGDEVAHAECKFEKGE